MGTPAARLFLFVWMAGMAIGGSLLMARHQRTLRPLPVAERRQAYGAIRLVHVLVPGCACSARVARQLAALETMPDETSGEIWWVDGPASQQLREQYGVQGGPWLMAFDAHGRRFYSGGYGRDVDPAMLARLASGEPQPVRRSYGCSFSDNSLAKDPSQ